MSAKVPSGQTRVEIARNAVEQVVTVFPPEGKLALRVYGSETPSAQQAVLHYRSLGALTLFAVVRLDRRPHELFRLPLHAENPGDLPRPCYDAAALAFAEPCRRSSISTASSRIATRARSREGT